VSDTDILSQARIDLMNYGGKYVTLPPTLGYIRLEPWVRGISNDIRTFVRSKLGALGTDVLNQASMQCYIPPSDLVQV
jgi:hypothetical protein